MKSLKFHSEWLPYGGLRVAVDGVRYLLSVRTLHAVYPYPEVMISVTAEPIDHSTDDYRADRTALGGDWVLDILDCGVEVEYAFREAASVALRQANHRCAILDQAGVAASMIRVQ